MIELKSALVLLVISIIAFSTFEAFAQLPTDIALPIHARITIKIDQSGVAHVLHNVTGTITKPLELDLINGSMTNLNVTNSNGSSVQYGLMQKIPVSIILTPTQRQMTLIKYDLTNVITETDGLSKWNYFEPTNMSFTEFRFPSSVDTIWANERPVYLGGLGLGQHGNGFRLQYVVNEPLQTQTVKSNDKNFVIGVKTLSGIGDYSFDPSQKTYKLNVNKPNVPVTIIMPQYLLGGPYDLTLNDKPILHQVFHTNQTHAWIGIIPNNNGTLKILGSTVNQQPQNATENKSQSSATIAPAEPTADNTIYIWIAVAAIAVAILVIIVTKKAKRKA